MLREFFSVFRADDPLAAMGERLATMLDLASAMAVAAGRMFFEGEAPREDRDQIYEKDIRVNKLQREIRKLIVARLSIRARSTDVPYCLYLLSLVKDVERLGDYAKNLSEVPDLGAGKPPDDELTRELQSIRASIEEIFSDASSVVTAAERERATVLIQQGRAVTKRCDVLVHRIAEAPYDARTAVALAMGCRYYKRFGGHLLNVLSSVVMPLHKLDYFDERAVIKD